MANFEIKHYKVFSLPNTLVPNVVYYVLDQSTGKVKTYISDKNGIPIPLLDLTGLGTILSVTGTGVTGSASNPIVDISNFISSQLGNLVELSAQDGKITVRPITSPDSSITVSQTSTELQIQLSEDIQNTLLDIQNDITNLQVDVTSLENSKFDNPTGTYAQYLDGLGVPTDFPPIPAGVTSTSEIINQGADNTSTYVEHDELAADLLLKADLVNGKVPLSQINTVTQTITNGVTDTSPSEDAVYDALALKQDVITNPITGTGTSNYISKFNSTSDLVNSIIYENANGGLGINTTGSSTPLTILDTTGNPMLIEAGSGGGLFSINTYGGAGASTSGGIVSRFTRGTKAVPLDVALGDRLGYNLSGGWAGGAFRHTAGINVMVDATGTVSATSLPTYFSFTTTANGSVIRLERMRIASSGNVLIGTTTDDAVNKLQVNGSVLLPTTGSFKFGGNTASFPAIGKLASGNHIGVFVADSSNYASFAALSVAVVNDVTCGSGGVFNFLSTGANRLQGGTVDTGISRLSAGVISVGSGTAGSFLGGLVCGNLLINTSTNDGVNKLQVNGIVKATQYKLSALNTAPTSATDTGILGEIRYDANYMYLCVATNTWKRSALTTW